MKKIIFFISVFIGFSGFSQNEEVLFSIDREKVTVEEFKNVYERNLDLVVDEDSKNIDKYLDLYVNYKLKIKEAYALQLDTSRSYKRELATYKNQLAAPYLQDNAMLEKLVEEAYFRTKNEIKAKHILVRFPKGTKPNDTLSYFNKITAYRNRIIAGESFEKVAAEVSEDPSAKRNNGNLGYFTAFKMVYPFEDAAYKTKIGEVSKPFKTRFGYHIVKVDAVRPSKGEFEVAHILIDERSIIGKAQIDSAYAKLNKGESFEKLAKLYSTDKGSAERGGKLPKFGTGKMVEQFENEVFKLSEVNSYSKPFKTKYGWHIVKLLKKHPVQTFDKAKKSLTKKIKSSGRSRSDNGTIAAKIAKNYNIKIKDNALAIFKESDRREFPKEELQSVLLTINDKEITQETFSSYIKHRRHLSIDTLLKNFKDSEVIQYYKDNLIDTEPAYKKTLKGYEDDLLLFDLMKQKIWDKAAKDTLGLKEFFNTSTKFKGQDFSKGKGKAMSAYQDFLEDDWIKKLHKKSKVKINKKALRRLKQQYNQ